MKEKTIEERITEIETSDDSRISRTVFISGFIGGFTGIMLAQLLFYIFRHL